MRHAPASTSASATSVFTMTPGSVRFKISREEKDGERCRDSRSRLRFQCQNLDTREPRVWPAPYNDPPPDSIELTTPREHTRTLNNIPHHNQIHPRYERHQFRTCLPSTPLPGPKSPLVAVPQIQNTYKDATPPKIPKIDNVAHGLKKKKIGDRGGRGEDGTKVGWAVPTHELMPFRFSVCQGGIWCSRITRTPHRRPPLYGPLSFFEDRPENSFFGARVLSSPRPA